MAAHNLPHLASPALARDGDTTNNSLFHGHSHRHSSAHTNQHHSVESVPRTLPPHVCDSATFTQGPLNLQSDLLDQRFPMAGYAGAKHENANYTTSRNAEDAMTELRAGVVQKPFKVRTEALINCSPHFATLQDPTSSNKISFPMKAIVNPEEEAMPDEHDDEHHDRSALFKPIPKEAHVSIAGPFFFPDIDEFSFELFVDWLNNGELDGPDDFHSMTHYVVLYIIAQRFQIESLENHAMDLIRAYYRKNNMTAPAFRLEYVYRNTDGACLLRDFFVHTAVYRALTERGPGSGADSRVSTSVRNALRRGKDLAADYAVTMADFQTGKARDVRFDDDSKWHVGRQQPAFAGPA